MTVSTITKVTENPKMAMSGTTVTQDVVQHILSFLPPTQAWQVRPTSRMFQHAYEELQAANSFEEIQHLQAIEQKKSEIEKLKVGNADPEVLKQVELELVKLERKKDFVSEFSRLVRESRVSSDELREVRVQIGTVTAQIAQRSGLQKTVRFLAGFIRQQAPEKELETLRRRESSLIHNLEGSICVSRMHFKREYRALLREERDLGVDSRVYSIFGGKAAFFALPHLSLEQRLLKDSHFLFPIMVSNTPKNPRFTLVQEIWGGTEIQCFFKTEGRWEAFGDRIVPVGNCGSQDYLSCDGKLREDKFLALKNWVENALKTIEWEIENSHFSAH